MNSRSKGIICIISAAFFVALMGMFVRLSGGIPFMQKCFFRNAVALVIAIGKCSGRSVKTRSCICPNTALIGFTYFYECFII